jgi:hypothetical protein
MKVEGKENNVWWAMYIGEELYTRKEKEGGVGVFDQSLSGRDAPECPARSLRGENIKV